MISTKIVTRIEQVSSAWIFEYYCNLSEKLIGQGIVIKSIFNPKDSNPSMHINPNRKSNNYSFNDFSTGKSGYGAHMVAELFNISMTSAINKIVDEYNDFIYKNPGGYSIQEYKEQAKYKVDSFVKRSWNKLDEKYWMSFGIGSSTLEKFNVAPLESYIMTNGEVTFEVNQNYLYGYFRQSEELYKIYQPKNKEKKFLKIKSYIQGTDQLNLESKYLLIGSSLKDIMCLDEMNLPIEVVSPDSENTMIKEDIIQAYRHKYKNICVLLDNDQAGICAMERYREQYGISTILLDLEKDVSDSVKKLGRDKVKSVLYPLLKEVLTNKSLEQ